MKRYSEKSLSQIWKKSAISFILLCLLGGGVFFFIENKPSVNTSNPAMLPISEMPSYTSFVGGWNDKVRAFDDLPEAYLLSSTDDKKMLQQFRKYIENFAWSQKHEVTQELQLISHQYPNSIWKFYSLFLNVYVGKHGEYHPDWSGTLSSVELRQMISKATGNHDYDESIKLLLASSGPCAYFSIYKYDLYKKGLSRNFKKCTSSIVDATNYPHLAPLIH